MLWQGQGAAMVRPRGGEAITMVYATGMRTDFGRTGALPQRVGVDPLIAVIVIGSGPARRQPRAKVRAGPSPLGVPGAREWTGETGGPAARRVRGPHPAGRPQQWRVVLMKKWNRWQDWVAVAAGVFAAVAVFWTTQQGMSTTLMVVFGALLVISGLVNLGMPGTPAMEWVQAVLALGLVLSPWIGAYTGATGAAWSSWGAGAVALIVTAAAIKPSTEGQHRIRISH